MYNFGGFHFRFFVLEVFTICVDKSMCITFSIMAFNDQINLMVSNLFQAVIFMRYYSLAWTSRNFVKSFKRGATLAILSIKNNFCARTSSNYKVLRAMSIKIYIFGKELPVQRNCLRIYLLVKIQTNWYISCSDINLAAVI